MFIAAHTDTNLKQHTAIQINNKDTELELQVHRANNDGFLLLDAMKLGRINNTETYE